MTRLFRFVSIATRLIAVSLLGLFIAVSIVKRATAYFSADTLYWANGSSTCSDCNVVFNKSAWTTASGTGEPVPIAIAADDPGCDAEWYEGQAQVYSDLGRYHVEFWFTKNGNYCSPNPVEWTISWSHY